MEEIASLSEKIGNDDIVNLQFNDWYRSGTNVFFSASNGNGLFICDYLSGEAKRICLFEDEEITQKHMHECVVEYENKLFFIPRYGKNIHIVSLNDYSQKTINIAKDCKNPHFSKAYVINNIAYLVPMLKDTPFSYLDMQDDSLSVDDEFWNKLDALPIDTNTYNGEKLIGVNSSFLLENKLFVSFINSSYLIEYDLISKETNWYPLGNNHVNSINYVNGVLVFTLTDNNGFVLAKFVDNNLKIIYEKKFDNEGIMYPYAAAFGIGDNVCLIPYYYSKFTLIDSSDFKTSDFDIICSNNAKKLVNESVFFESFFETEECIYLFPRGINRLVIYNKSLNSLTEKCIFYRKNSPQTYSLNISNNFFCKENEMLLLTTFLENI